MSGNIPDKSIRLKKESSWLDSFLLILVEILFDPTVLWFFREERMLEISLQSVSEIKH